MKNSNDILIEGSAATWDMGFVQGDVQGTYSGTFTFRCFLTPTQMLTAGREYREMLGSNFVLATEHEGYVTWCLTQLKQRVIKAPPFWYEPTQSGGMPGDIADLNVLYLVMDAAQRAQDQYQAQRTKDQPELVKQAINAAEKVLESEEG